MEAILGTSTIVDSENLSITEKDQAYSLLTNITSFTLQFPCLSPSNTMPKVVKAIKKSTKAKLAPSGGSSNGGAHTKILNTVAALQQNLGREEVERKKLPALTGIQGKSTIANALTKLKNSDWMTVTPTKVSITDKGMANADLSAIDQIDLPTNDADYHESVKNQFGLKPKAIELFDVIADGRPHKKKDVVAALGMKMNSTFANLLTGLKKLNIIEYTASEVQLHADMFPFGGRPE